MDRYPELVFAFVAPVGTDLEAMERALQASLDRVNYRTQEIRLSALLRDIPAPPWSELRVNGPEDERLDTYMKAGNELRRRLERNEAMALLAVGAIRVFREQTAGDASKVIPRQAYLLRSLKRPEEASLLRRVYGPRFVLLAGYSARPTRVSNLSRRVAQSRSRRTAERFRSIAEALIQRDEAEEHAEFGQNVRDTFPLADAIFDPSDDGTLRASMERFVELLFGHPFHTPTPDEQGMFLAYAAALRSASLSRQVGAALCRPDGSLVAIGANEVPKPGGGLYWAGDHADQRDHVLGYEMGEQMRRAFVRDVLQRLQEAGWLAPDLARRSIEELSQNALTGNPAPLADAEFMKTIEYFRAVHAEMATLMEAARYGIATKDCVLYTTTYPCHDCAKHLLAAGVRRVVYMEPYPKSLATEMYPQAVEADGNRIDDRLNIERFVGVAPRRYADFFGVESKRRKGPDGQAISWQASGAAPQLPDYLGPASVVLQAETEVFVKFMQTMEQNGLARKEEQHGTQA